MDFLSIITGVGGTALVTAVLAWVLKAYRTKKKESRADSEEQLRLHQEDEDYWRDSYKDMVKEYRAAKDLANKELVELRKATSEEAHSLRNQIQQLMIEDAKKEERLKVFQSRSCELWQKNQCPPRTGNENPASGK